MDGKFLNFDLCGCKNFLVKSPQKPPHYIIEQIMKKVNRKMNIRLNIDTDFFQIFKESMPIAPAHSEISPKSEKFTKYPCNLF